MGLASLVVALLAASSTRPAIIRLRGGETSSSPIVIRLHTKEGLKRVSVPGGADATLAELQRAITLQHRVPPGSQELSSKPAGAEAIDTTADAERTLESLGLRHGSFLYLNRRVGGAGIKAAPAGSRAAAMMAPARKARSGSVTRSWNEIEVETKEADVVMASAPNSRCQFVAIDGASSRDFAEYMLQEEFESTRVAQLYGRRADEGIYVDVLYEPPQEPREDLPGALPKQLGGDAPGAQAMSAEASAEAKRVEILSAALGLERVGWAFAHPARAHKLSAEEIMELCSQRSRALEAAAKAPGPKKGPGPKGPGPKGPGAKAGKAAAAAGKAAAGKSTEPKAQPHFVCVLFRPVYEEDTKIEGEVTAEAYESTPQAEELFEKNRLQPSPEEAGQLRLDPELKLTLTVEGKPASAVDAFYFVSRVHDMSRPHASKLRLAFPPQSRAEMRKMHLRKWLQRQREADLPFETLAADWNLLLFAGSVLPEADFPALCSAVAFTTQPHRASTSAAFAAEKAEALDTLRRCEASLCTWCGLEPPAAPAAAPGAGAADGSVLSVWLQLCDLFKSCVGGAAGAAP